MFLGEFQHTIDDKGRLAVPAKFRTELAGGLVVTKGMERCLYAFPMDYWKELAGKLARLPVMQEDARHIARHIFSGAMDAQLDRLGRVVLPQYLRTYAGLQDDVVVAGVYTRFEVWSQEGWHAERSMAEEQSSVFAEHLASLGI